MFCVTLEYEKENSEYNLSFWSHPRIISRSCRSGFQAAHVLNIYNCVQIQKKKTAFQLRYITKFFVPYQAEWTEDFISHPVFEILLYRTMLTILLSALIIINLLNWIPV